MSFQSFVTERLAIITAQLNAIGTNAKKIDELPVQSNLDPASKIHVSRGGNSESLEVQEIINSINNNTYNQLLSIGEITLVDNVVTIPANARAQISQINYNTVAITTIPIPYAAAGLTRTDILVFNTSSLIVRVPGNETAGIAVRPNIPINTVLVTEINVTELAIGDPTPPVTLEALATKLDKDGYTGTAQILDDRITVLEGSDTNSPVYNNIRKSTGFSLVAQNLTINALWEWDILNVNYSNTLAVNKTIPYCVSGLKRIDYVVPNKFNSFDIISGEETSGILVAPSLPNNGIYVTYFIVTDSEVGEASIPIIGENYITKASKSFIRMFYTGDVDVVSIDDKSYLKFEQGMTSLKSINIPDSKNFYFGKSYIIKNGTTNNVTLHHQSGAGTFKFNFPNAQNLVLKPEESINIVLRAINYTNTGGLLDYVGISSGPIAITDVTGLAAELDSKLDAADYNNHYKGVYITEAALVSAHPTASVGDYAQINEVGATDVVNYNWDGEENIWVKNSTQSTPISNTDALPEGTSNLYFQTARVLATLLNGVSFVTGGTIVSTDSVLVAFGKLQKQISDNLTAIGLKQNTLVSGENIKTLNNQTLLGPGNIEISSESKISFTVFVNTVNGNDTTGLLEFQNKPFRTEAAAFNAIPDNINLWTIQFIDGNATRQVTSAFRNKNVIYKTTFGGIINFNLSCFVGPQFNRYPPNDGNPIRIEAPLAHAIFNVDNVRLGTTAEPFSIITRELTLIGNMQIKSTSLIPSKIICDIFNTNMTATDYGFLNATAANIKIGTWNYTRFNYCSNDVTDAQALISSLEVGSLNLINTASQKVFGQGTIATFKLGNVTGAGSIALVAGKKSYSPTRRSEIIFNNSIISPTCFVTIQLFETTNLFISGNIISDLENVDLGSADGLGNEYNFLNFTGRIAPQTARYFNIDGKLTMQNSSIKVSSYLFSWRDRVGNIPTTGGFTSVRTIGYNTVLSDNPNVNTLIEYQINPLTFLNEGSLKTNFASLGKNILENTVSATSKEKLKEKVVRSKLDIINRVLDSSTTYVIDGKLTLLSGEYIEVPATGLTMVGYGFNVSGISKNVTGQSIFKSPASGGSGDFITRDIVYNSGAGSVFNLNNVAGNNAIEMNDVNFENCASLGNLTNYRQFTGTTNGFYGCLDGFKLAGNWTGFKLTNSNVLAFGGSGTFIKKDVNTLFSNRMYLDFNLSFNDGGKLCDFDETNFASDELFQINNTLLRIGGVTSEANTASAIPNIGPNNSKCRWTNSLGISLTAQKFQDLKSATKNWRISVNDAGVILATEI